MTTKEENTLNETLGNLGKWYIDLSAERKKKTAVFAIVGDMEGKNNYELIKGDDEDVVMTLAQTMIGSFNYYNMVKDAVKVAEEYLKQEAERENEKDNLPKKLYS